MTHPNANESKRKALTDTQNLQKRIAELHEEIARFSLELAHCETAQAGFRAKEDAVQGISYAAEIFELQQEKLRLKVEIELLEKKIRRLELGYAEEGQALSSGSDPLF